MYEFFYGVFKVGLNTLQNSPATQCSALQNAIVKELRFYRNCTKQTCLRLLRVLAGTEIFIFPHAPTSGTSMLIDNFMKYVFLRAPICRFTNGQIRKRTYSLPIDK